MELPVWCMAGDYRPSFPFVLRRTNTQGRAETFVQGLGDTDK